MTKKHNLWKRMEGGVEGEQTSNNSSFTQSIPITKSPHGSGSDLDSESSDIAEKSLSLLRSLSEEHIERKKRLIESQHPSEQSLHRIHEIQQRVGIFNNKCIDKQLQSNSNDSSIMGNRQSDHHDRDLEYGYAEADVQQSFSKHPRSFRKERSSSSRGSKSGKQSRAHPNSHKSVDDMLYDHSAQQYYTLDELVDHDIYHVKQKSGYFSILFSIVQTIILASMMIMCSIAPFNINPMIGPYPDALDYWGAKNASKILDDNEWWRFITPLFLHGGIIHLVCNISVQLDIGAFFEREWGSGLWLIIYMASGIGSSIFSCIFNADNISVGSSGAVMGLFGGKLGEIFCRACESQRTKAAKIGHAVRMEQLSQSLCSVILVMAFSFIPFVDWAAHLGGVICGFIAGICCFAPWIKTKHCAVFWLTVGAAMNLAFYATTLSYFYTYVKPRGDLGDVCAYYQQYFQDYECNCQID